jgi:hypothetical protein
VVVEEAVQVALCPFPLLPFSLRRRLGVDARCEHAKSRWAMTRIGSFLLMRCRCDCAASWSARGKYSRAKYLSPGGHVEHRNMGGRPSARNPRWFGITRSAVRDARRGVAGCRSLVAGPEVRLAIRRPRLQGRCRLVAGHDGSGRRDWDCVPGSPEHVALSDL